MRIYILIMVSLSKMWQDTYVIISNYSLKATDDPFELRSIGNLTFMFTSSGTKTKNLQLWSWALWEIWCLLHYKSSFGHSLAFTFQLSRIYFDS